MGLTLFATLFAGLALSSPLRRAYGNSSLPPPLRFTSNGTFQISIFEDLHFGENAWDTWGPQQDINSVKVMNEVLDAETQQLVVLNGDLITGENAYLENATVKIDQIVAPLLARGLTWASTYGNHDSQYNLSRHAILAREHRWPRHARTQQMVHGPDAGVSNYYLPVYPSTGNTDEPCLLLWFFDSRGGFHFQQRNASSGAHIGQPDWVDQSVVSWFEATNARLTAQYNRSSIPSLAFVHIPTNASQAAQMGPGIDPRRQPGINDDAPNLAQQAQGWCEDGSNGPECVYGGQDVPFMRALASTKGLMAVFSGHDHGDTWCYKWDEVLPGMEVRGDGGVSRQVLAREAAMMALDGVGEVETWIRLESGDEVGRVGLNATYGVDLYAETPDTMTHCPTCNYSVITNMPGTK
ncbi:hypothetical protein LTS02_005940 [Friedmanniomyces endolithicus]|nr:hypothetical protein LTR75_012775 [Friedmanniomyces endolithicus]KAK0844818.1 hypothetical protein LTR03_007813 [Friedmanniomyces endolithicus]KAK0864558.1 hypothetical protein LTS02_005940 [Friedmanniomyces endolithicus]KAK0871197.1 hypothetical protein LTR87_012943 [Friedmanniomyces endolithicus]